MILCLSAEKPNYESAVPPRRGSRSYQRSRLFVGEAAEVVEGVETGGVGVGPDGLDGVAANVDDAHELKGARAEGLGGVFVDVAHDVFFSVAAGTGTVAAQGFHRDKGFGSIIPFYGEFGANLLNVGWFHFFMIARPKC